MKRVGLKTALCRYILVICIILGLSFSLWGQFGGGRGTEEDPWQIGRPEHLNSIRDYLGAAHSDKYYIQTSDIDLGLAPWNEGEGWVPIGNSAAAAFQGNYNGRGYEIKNLTINRPLGNFQALFGYTLGASIMNLGVVDAYVNGRTTVSTLVGYQGDGTVIRYCYSSGDLFAEDMMGGYVGGLVGQMHGANSVLEDCYSVANVTMFTGTVGMIPAPPAGGICSYQAAGVLRRVYAAGRVFQYGNSVRVAAVIGGAAVQAEFSYLFWNNETSGQTLGVGQNQNFPGNSTLEMLQANLYQEFDFDRIWGINAGLTYPWLRVQEGPRQVNIPSPVNLRGQGSFETMLLTWQPPVMEIEPVGYNVYQDGQRLNDEPVAALQYQVSELRNWQYHEYTVSAIYEIGESSRSDIYRGSAVDFAGGSGTLMNPYQIETADQLNGIRYALDSYFIQLADIDIGVRPYNEGEGWNPIGTSNHPFTGNYNGDYLTIENLTINRNVNDAQLYYQSLFGRIENATLRAIRLTNADVTGSRETGMLVGFCKFSNIHNSSVSGRVTGSGLVGGLAGRIQDESAINQCYSAGFVTGINQSSDTGGLVGYRTGDSVINNSYSTATVKGNQQAVGGLLGNSFEGGSISNSYAAGWVSVDYMVGHVGGLIGYHREGDINNCYWNVESTTQSHSNGGGEGRTTQEMVTQVNFEGWDFENIWAIDEGLTYPYLQWQRSAGGHNRPAPYNFDIALDFPNQQFHLSWEMIGTPARYDIYRDNRLVASVNHPTTNWSDTQLELYSLYTYQVVAIFIIDEVEYPTSFSNKKTAILVSPYAGGSGRVDDPFQVETPTQLQNIRHLLSYHFIQIRDIDLNVPPWNQGEGWLPIGTNNNTDRFTGSYDGDNYLISNLFINRPAGTYQGLFAYVELASLSNIHLHNVNISANQYIGSLVAYQHNSRIDNCSVTGRVSSVHATTSYVGGLLAVKRFGDSESNALVNSYSTATVTGANYSGGLLAESWNGDIVNCWASGNVTGRQYSGGLIGYLRTDAIIHSFAKGNVNCNNTYNGGLAGVASGRVENSYARGNVNGTSHIGGLLGRNTGLVSNSYSSGRIVAGATNVGGLIGSNTGQVANSYWDIETSGFEVSQGGEGRNTRQMVYPYDQMTYLDWDFDEIWAHDFNGNINNQYPILYYQAPIRPDAPDVTIEMVTVEGVNYIRLVWEAVEHALSYRIYASDDAYSNNWGEPLDIVGIEATEYLDPIADDTKKFYRVTASSEPPEE